VGDHRPSSPSPPESWSPAYPSKATNKSFAYAVGSAGETSAPSGKPSIYLPAVRAASWVFATGNDWDGAVARKPVAGQVLQQQWLATVPGDTFWVQSTTAPTTIAGLVTITDDLPTTNRWNLAAVEIQAVNS
jgi:hypothetical protein